MKKLAMLSFVILLTFSSNSFAQANKDKDDYLFLITITRSDSDQEFIYTDLYVLSGTQTISSVNVGSSRGVGSGEETCDYFMGIAVKGFPGLHIKDGKEKLLDGVHTSWNIEWNDILTIVSQEYNRTFSVIMQKCSAPLIKVTPTR